MGDLNTWNLDYFIKRYGCESYVETGTGAGGCLRHAVKYGFNKYYSIDIAEHLITAAKKEFKDCNVEFFNESSVGALDKLVPTLPKDKPVFFWLDAHFPELGTDIGTLSLGESLDKYGRDVWSPLLQEIRVIRKHRDISRDCFIIDDWRIFAPELFLFNYSPAELEVLFELISYRNYTAKKYSCLEERELILKEFFETHSCQALLGGTGTLLAFPKPLKQGESNSSHLYF